MDVNQRSPSSLINTTIDKMDIRHAFLRSKVKGPEVVCLDTQKLCEAVFRNPSKMTICSPETITWQRFLERQILTLWSSYFAPALSSLDHTENTHQDAFQLFLQISILLRDTQPLETTIDSIATKLFANSGINSEEIRNARRHEIRQVIFAVTGLLTMLYTPAPTISAGNFTIVVPEDLGSMRCQQSCEKAQNALFGFLKGFGILLPIQGEEEEDSPVEEASEELHISKLNYASLRNISNIQISWVNDLSSHLYFNDKKQVLSLFRLPSFCVAHSLDELATSLFHGVLNSPLAKLSGDGDLKDSCSQAYLEEVFLTYRLLFGLDKHSRRRFKSEQKRRARSSGPPDRFLNKLCANARMDMDTSERLEAAFRPGGVYIKHNDFPIFGERLMILQSYSIRQSPSRFRAFWKDRRKPADFLNLWVVIIFGASALLLSLLQLIIAIIALAVAFKQLEQR